MLEREQTRGWAYEVISRYYTLVYTSCLSPQVANRDAVFYCAVLPVKLQSWEKGSNPWLWLAILFRFRCKLNDDGRWRKGGIETLLTAPRLFLCSSSYLILSNTSSYPVPRLIQSPRTSSYIIVPYQDWLRVMKQTTRGDMGRHIYASVTPLYLYKNARGRSIYHR